MKKSLLCIFFFFLLSGCSAEKNKTSETENTQSTEVSTTKKETNFESSASTPPDSGSTNQSSFSEAGESEQTRFKESSIIESKVDLTGLKSEILTDNAGKRVLLFKDEEGQVKYKSIFIKSTNFLKIIDSQNHDKVIFDEAI